ncbi:MAG TPA: winged helix-turn-helix domain-containing protein [Sphingomicrobium sp.]|nr:winged helix-turn-helix domain-containing protein [Sphingomicrobium sp.]
MGETKHDGLAIPSRVVLAHELPFTLGILVVQPATRQVQSGGTYETIEPRVMEVLVALARANGSIVTRDELIERCWGGRIVTDDAINRVLSRIRQVASDIGRGSFKVETVTKVGYRLVDGSRPRPGPPIESPTAASPAIERRTMIAGAGAAAAAALGAGIAWQRPWGHRVPSEAQELYRRGDLAQRVGTPDQSRQSITYFERAVRIDPLYSAAWGALALAYTHNLDGYGEAELSSLPGRIRSAAAKALELDADNADAQLAVVSIDPLFRNWTRVERDVRRICERFPRHWLAHGRLAMLMYHVGRLEDGIALHRQVIAIDPMIPFPYAVSAAALSNLGRVQEADALLDEAGDKWPAHPLVWFMKYNHLLFSGRPKAAAALIADPDALPSGFGPEQVEPRLELARAVEGQPLEIERCIERHRGLAGQDPTHIPVAALIFTLLGRLDLTFASLERYYFSRGPFLAPSLTGQYARRNTDTLFWAPMALARPDPRFAGLLHEIGLEDYWRQTRTVPDFRRRQPSDHSPATF